MPRYTEVVRNTSTRIEMVVLPENLRVPANFSVTTAGTNLINAVVVTVTATPIKLDAGTRLLFGAQTVILAADAALGATSLTPLTPLSAAITAGVVASTIAPRMLTGASTGSLKFSSDAVDTSGFGDGITKEMMKVSAGWAIDVSGIYTRNAAVTEVLYPLGSNGPMSVRESFLRVIYGDGTVDSGVCQVMNYSEEFALRDAKKFSCTLEGRAELTRVFAV